MQLDWPSPLEYNEAVQNPLISFTDLELQRGEPELNQLGLPKPATGGFATVYKMICSQNNWAVRCFLKSAYDQELRYDRIAKHLQEAKLASTVNFEYQPGGFRFKGRHLPILKMQWVDGVTLDNFVNVAYGNKEAMLALAEKFLQLYLECQAAGIAHGDLQHGNIMVTNQSLYLVDYDGMYVPSMNGANANELGHRNYQHPLRTSSDFGPGLDNFSAWVILISLYAIALDSALWQTLVGGEECLLFKQSDFRLPASSETFSLLTSHPNDQIRALSSLLLKFVEQPLEYTPPLDRELFPEATSGLTADWAQLVAAAREQHVQTTLGGKGSANLAAGQSSNLPVRQLTPGETAKLLSGIRGTASIFDRSKYAEAAQYYEQLLSTLNNQVTAPEPVVQIECLLQLGYYQIYLGNMAKAEMIFRNGLVLAKANNLFLLAMRCAVCMLVAQFGAGGPQPPVDVIERHFPSQSDMLMALRAEMAGPLVNNAWLSGFIYQLATDSAKAGKVISRSLYDIAIAACASSAGDKSLLMALCLQGRATCDLKSGFKASSLQDLHDAMDLVIAVEGDGSEHLLAMRLDLIRILIKSAALLMQPGDYKSAETALFSAFAEIDKLTPQALPRVDYRELVSKALMVYANTRDGTILSKMSEILARALPEKWALVTFLCQRINDCLDFGHYDEAKFLLTKAIEELQKLGTGAVPIVYCDQLLSATLRLLPHCEDTGLAGVALDALKCQDGLDQVELAKLLTYMPNFEESR